MQTVEVSESRQGHLFRAAQPEDKAAFGWTRGGEPREIRQQERQGQGLTTPDRTA